MISLEQVRKQLLSQIELELCRIYDAGSKAPQKLREFYDHVSELPLSNFIFTWYRINADKVHIECIGDEVRIYKEEGQDEEPEQFVGIITKTDVHDDLIDQARDNKN